MTGAGRRWFESRVHFADPPARLLADCLGPLLDDLRRNEIRGYPRPHWLRGPHVRVVTSCTDEQYRTTVCPLVRQHCEPYLHAHPSCGPGGGEPGPVQQRLAALERITEPLAPPVPDNTLVFPGACADDGPSPRVTAFLHEFHARAADLVVATAHDVLAGTPVSRTAAEMITATVARTADGGVVEGAISLRSHAEAFLTYSPDAAGLRAAWESAYRAQHDALLRDLGPVVSAAADGREDATPRSRRWLHVLDEGLRLADAHGGVGALVDEHDRANLGDFADLTPQDDGRGYAAWIRRHAGRLAAHYRSDRFLRLRFALNLTYLVATSIGVTERQRYLLCFLLSNLVEELTDSDLRRVAEGILG